MSVENTKEVINGKVKWYDPRKGIGYIETENGDVFVHFSAIKEGHLRAVLLDGEDVTLTICEGKKGPEASDVYLAHKPKNDDE